MRLNYPANLKIIRVPCTGKVDVIHLLKAIERGADGACVIGCMEGECLYNRGNFRARKRVMQARKVLRSVGIEEERLQMYNLSSSEGPKFALYANDMTEKIKALGPNPLKAAKAKLKAA
jgi:coenzyme F420-reducing hydrogenase delta subunit